MSLFSDSLFLDARYPKIGDIYQRIMDNGLFSALMVVEIHEGEIVLGTGTRVFWNDLNDTTKWKLIKEAN